MPSISDRLLSALGGSYTIERELTGGGMALVFVAEDHDLGRKVVIKILPPELAASVSAIASSASSYPLGPSPQITPFDASET